MYMEHRMRNVIGSQISTTKFTWVPKTREFIAEISDLHGSNPLGALYNDACDAGFVLVSQKTNLAIPFYLRETQRDADHDVKFWEFHPCNEAVRQNPSFEDVTVIILND